MKIKVPLFQDRNTPEFQRKRKYEEENDDDDHHGHHQSPSKNHLHDDGSLLNEIDDQFIDMDCMAFGVRKIFIYFPFSIFHIPLSTN